MSSADLDLRMITYGWDLVRTQPLERLRTASPVRASNPGPPLRLSSALPECLPLRSRRIKRPQARLCGLTAPLWALARA